MRLPKKCRVLVTAIGAPPGRNAVRALLKHENVEVIGADASALANYPYAIQTFVLPKAASDSFPAAILRLAEEQKIDLLLPCIEDEVLRLADFQEEFHRRGIALFLPKKSTLLSLVDKELLQQIAEKAGVPFLKSIRIESLADLEKLSPSEALVTKPLIAYGAKGVRIHAKSALDRKGIEEDLQKYGALLAQTYVPGGDGSMHLHCAFYDRHGRQRLNFQSYSTKTLFAFGGPATAGTSIWDDTLDEIFQKIMAQVPHWVGPIVLEFKKHAETGIYYIMDANPRIWGYSSLADDAGIPFPLAYLLETQNLPYQPETYLLGAELTRQPDQSDETIFRFADGREESISRKGLPKSIWVGGQASDFQKTASVDQRVFVSSAAPPPSGLAADTLWLRTQEGRAWEEDLYLAALATNASQIFWPGGEIDFHDLQAKAWKAYSSTK